MAFETGTATDFADLYNKLRDFLTTNADLVSAGEEWLQLSGPGGTLTDADEIVLQGPGTAGTDEILVAMKPSISVGLDYYNLAFYGLTSYNPALGDIAAQIDVTVPGVVHLWNDPMPYWFVANGRRFIVVVRVASVYQPAYCGFVLPYVVPSLWPYPHFIGGVSESMSGRYSDTGERRRAFFHPGQNTARMCFPDLRWLEVWNNYETNTTVPDGSEISFSSFARSVRPYASDATPIRENLDGSYSLTQTAIHCTNPYPAQMAALEGVYRVSGFSNAAENIVTVGGVDYLVVPNVYRTDWSNFAAIRLE